MTTTTDRWTETWDWAKAMFDAAAKLFAPLDDPDYRPELAFYNWKNTLVGEKITAEADRYEGQGVTASDGFHMLYAAVGAARAAGVGSIVALDAFVRAYEGLPTT